jgi:hypothetical protein
MYKKSILSTACETRRRTADKYELKLPSPATGFPPVYRTQIGSGDTKPPMQGLLGYLSSGVSVRSVTLSPRHHIASRLIMCGIIRTSTVGRDSSVGIATRYGDRSQVGVEIFTTRPDWPWGPSSLLYNGYRVLPGRKAAGGCVEHPLHLAQRLNIELYLYLHSETSWAVLGWTLSVSLHSSASRRLVF